MKKIIIISIIGILLFTSFSVFADTNEKNDGQTTITYSFEKPIIKEIEINGASSHRVEMKDAPNGGNPGEPSLPVRGTKILLPPSKKVDNIEVIPGEMVCLGSGFMVEPVGQPVPLSEIDSAPIPVPDEAIYNSKDPFPGKLFTEVGTYCFRGYEILVLALHPVQYIPATGELFYYPDLRVSVEPIEDDNINPLFRGLEKDKQEIIGKVDNPALAGSYNLNTRHQTLGYDLLIITTESLKDGFEPLALAHNATGVKTVIKTLSDIGSDDAEDIRDYIRDAYTNWGIDYVLLGGDDNVIPARDFYFGRDCNLVFKPILGPSDLYYGGLDGSWNRPSMFKPSNRDISITDPNVDGSGGGIFSDPVVDIKDYVVGDSSMLWTVTTPEAKFGYCNLTFESPYLNLSDMNWLNFKIRSSRHLTCIIGIKIHCSDGNEIYFGINDFNDIINVGFPFFVPKKWVTEHVYLPHFNDAENFNWNSVDHISFEINDGGRAIAEDTIRLDGIHFSDFCDDYYGEPGEDDLYAEVYVGRACVGNSREVNNFVSKTISYMFTSPDDPYLKDALMVGQFTGFGDEANWGGNYTDEIIDGTNNHNYTTVGIPSDEYNINKLYDRDWEENGWPEPIWGSVEGGWPKDELINRINNNVHLMNHMGHGEKAMAMSLNNLDVYRLKNDKYFFLYSMTCSAGHFDGMRDCFAEFLTVKTGHGAFATIMNARTGWESMSLSDLGITDGPANRFHRQFWDAVFGENITVISKANQDSKEDNICSIENWLMRATYYQLNLFGDPAVDFFNHIDNTQPNKPEKPSGSNSLKIGVEYDFTTSTTDVDGEQVKYGWDWQGDFIVDDWTDFYPSGTEVTVTHSWPLPGPRMIRVKAMDSKGFQGDWSDPLIVWVSLFNNNQNVQSQPSTPAGTEGSSSLTSC